MLKQLDEESAMEQITFKKIKRKLRSEIEVVSRKISVFHEEIEQLKQLRKQKSNRLQFQLFEQYAFLNADGDSKSLNDIFRETPSKLPPAGAGECTAPKLFQFAFQHKLKPLELLEFWWGASPNSMIRIQGNFYPSCKSKCEPILGHMLSVTKHDKMVVSTKNADLNNVDILFQDAYLAAINKPHDVLSVPGKVEAISVAAILRELFPHAEQPMLVHRLDRATSGILLVALNHEIYVKLQRQFTNREVKKRYVALLSGKIDKKNGVIDLPIRVDLDNRPQQLVCYEHGLPAETLFDCVGHEQGLSRVHFFPITGRTHQLRVHAAHKDGLNCPIYGDDLYGTKAKRLCLHATEISFVHPVFEHEVTVYSEVPF
jgi:tRNA pseudouridine32 synthase/23S rRNA pseudouridine746 synthase